MILSDLQVYM